MQSILPQQKLAPTRVNPKILVLYGVPKVGKTTLLSQLKSCLILDWEGGAEMYETIRLPVRSISGPTATDAEGKIIAVSMDTVFNEIMANGQAQVAAGKKVEFPYKFIAIDTIDKMEDGCEISATIKYKNGIIGKKFDGNSVLELPNGAGYYHLRNEVLGQIDKFAGICKYLILIAHVKEKMLDKGGIQVESKDLSLAGKLSSMVCAKADGIGYLYREPKKPIFVSFETADGAVMGSRGTRLSGQRFEFDWSKIYQDEPDLLW